MVVNSYCFRCGCKIKEHEKPIHFKIVKCPDTTLLSDFICSGCYHRFSFDSCNVLDNCIDTKTYLDGVLLLDTGDTKRFVEFIRQINEYSHDEWVDIKFIKYVEEYEKEIDKMPDGIKSICKLFFRWGYDNAMDECDGDD